MSESRSPLARLVLFMVCLSVAGAFVAGVHYAAVDLPQQDAARLAPSNGVSGVEFMNCMYACIYSNNFDKDKVWECEQKNCLPLTVGGPPHS